MTDLTTSYLGLQLRSPIVASASPLNRSADFVAALEAHGVAAIVLPSLFEEEIVYEANQLNGALDAGTDQFAEALSYFPAVTDVPGVGERYLRDLERVKHRAQVPVIASLNASTPGAWLHYARLLEQAGADAIELNLYHVAADPRRSGADHEDADVAIVEAVRAEISVPLVVKLSPYYSAMANFGARVVEAGAGGLVLFNRFYQPDIDLDAMDVVPRVELSTPSELRLPLRWIAILRPELGSDVALAASSGVHAGTDVVKALMAGADVAMMTSAILEHGPAHVATVESELRAWLDDRQYASVDELRGSASFVTSPDPSAFERANYMRTLHSWTGRAGAFSI